MAKPKDRIKLTKTAVDKLEADTKAYRVYDKNLSGFGVRVAPSGVKTWFVEYRPRPGGRGVNKRRMTLGKVGEKMTPDEYRAQAADILADVTKGRDPAKELAEERGEMRVRDLVELYSKEGCYWLRGKNRGKPMKPATKTNTLARLNNHVVHLLGDRRLSEVTPTVVKKMFSDIATGKSAREIKNAAGRRVIVRGGEGAARKVARDLSAVFTFGIRHQDVPLSENPCEHADITKTDGMRTRYLDLDEVDRLGRALDTLEGQGVNPKALNIARLWALTGCRRDEIAGLKWSEIDFARNRLVLEETKTGKSERPLDTSALELLATIPREDDSPYVFPATSGDGHYQGTKRIWPKAIQLADLPGVTPHTLRHTLGSAAVSSGETLAMTGAILGHANARSTTRYAHVQPDPAAEATSRAVRGIAAALKGQPKGEIIPMKKGKSG